MPRVSDPAERKRRDAEIWRLYAAGNTMEKLAERFDLAVSRISEIITRERGKYGQATREQRRVELAAQLDELRSAMQVLADAEPVPLFRGTEPVVERDESGEIVTRYVDHSARVTAAKTIVDIQARMAKMLGLDAAEVVDQTTTVRYSFEGVDTGELT